MIVSSPEIAKKVTKTHGQIFANRPKILAAEILTYNSSDVVFSPNGNYWRKLRKICTLELFSVKRVQSLKNIREEKVSMLMKDIDEYEGCVTCVMSLSKKFFPVTNSIVARAAFGKKTKNVVAILPTIEHEVKLTTGFNVIDFYPSLKFLRVITGIKATMIRIHNKINEMVKNIITDHKEKKLIGNHAEAAEDLDVLLRIQKEDDFEIPLSSDNIKAVVLDVFVGGTETASTTVEWAMTELLRNPVAMKKAQEESSELLELKYVAAIIKETLRMHPPVPMLVPRENIVRDVKSMDMRYLQRVGLLLMLGQLEEIPNIGTNQKKLCQRGFWIAQLIIISKGQTLSLSHLLLEEEYALEGRRICPGVIFATAVVELVIPTMLYRFEYLIGNFQIK
ncbi:hypothetical protein K1719_046614 [Acacia pycnantha]|nr:hypothetical protein K1719_046614 [Acacia pycnantha]